MNCYEIAVTAGNRLQTTGRCTDPANLLKRGRMRRSGRTVLEANKIARREKRVSGRLRWRESQLEMRALLAPPEVVEEVEVVVDAQPPEPVIDQPEPEPRPLSPPREAEGGRSSAVAEEPVARAHGRRPVRISERLSGHQVKNIVKRLLKKVPDGGTSHKRLMDIALIPIRHLGGGELLHTDGFSDVEIEELRNLLE